MSIIRLHLIVEGQTEETFVNTILRPHLARFEVMADAHMITTNRRYGRMGRGGISHYAQIKQDMELWIKQDKHRDARFTTMIDLYGLPADFPRFVESRRLIDAYERVQKVEQAFGEDVNDYRFVPYIQLHEFEALILADPQKLDWEFLEHDQQIRKLGALVAQQNPELIDDGVETAPSKRIEREIPEYAGRKASAGPIVVGKIGLEMLRQRCHHFGEWLGRLEMLAIEQPL
ncbi:MAG TPA: DUF4276 family protein [Chloroflexota bacterium]|nr:DUF4276 family protein [Chloroflexota bacterium]HUM70299.1 DUF4276 family protein [Chloroflexota bacterium]